eukprot:TRINITY_DN3391_c0_g1_i1.p1 TRINITY_DN3391_c0_g1~~TRINITY_DN3391_c0_g1_i1.p1  ORF type:complete len:609 (-),score=109.36 TRINITY_DN3391_c0_g1_i1:135-1865(-)
MASPSSPVPIQNVPPPPFHIPTPTEIQQYRDFQRMLDCPQSNQSIGFNAALLIELFVALWFVSWVAELVLSRKWKVFRHANVQTRRNIMTYFHEIIITTILMVWCFVLLDPLLFSINYNKDTITQMLFVGLCVIVLYVFELIYRHEMRWQLLLHHLVTILLVILCIYKFEHDSFIDPTGHVVLKAYNLKGAILMALTALTEQPIFVGLLLYRVGYKLPWLFYFSSIQNALFKLTLHIGLIAMYFLDQVYKDDFWKWFLWVCIEMVLLPVQMYACWVQFSIGRRLAIKIQKEKDEALTAAAFKGTPADSDAPPRAPSTADSIAASRSKSKSSTVTISNNSTTISNISIKATRHFPSVTEVSSGEYEVEVNDDSSTSGEHSDDDYTAPSNSERAKRSLSGILVPAGVSHGHESSDDDNGASISGEEDDDDIDDLTAPSRVDRKKSFLYAHPRTAQAEYLPENPTGAPGPALLRKKSTKLAVITDQVSQSPSKSDVVTKRSSSSSGVGASINSDDVVRKKSSGVKAQVPEFRLGPKKEEAVEMSPRSDGSGGDTARSTTAMLPKHNKRSSSSSSSSTSS